MKISHAARDHNVGIMKTLRFSWLFSYTIALAVADLTYFDNQSLMQSAQKTKLSL